MTVDHQFQAGASYAGADPISGALAACANGDRAALRAIYDREASTLLGVATRIVRRRELAEEVLQDAFVQIWRRASSFDPALGSGRAWVYAVVRNRALNQLRDDRHMPVDDRELESFSARDDEADDAFERLAESDALKRCLGGLDPLRRKAVLLAYVSGMTHGEIAGKLGAPLGTVKAWIRRSLLSLRACLS
ncbi:sigma-70 family RNA polymerase sigma factor [Methylopila sp. M107]|uniref:sigma-70 family RNA polymerase sigma factor n=1 Tax=Methylopila sp. M107 TaxID=1101190 RepID=UPI00035E12AB|nr:sigma-70 family RNA polymerase sigma factor [Methylopila sp. M107]